MGSKLCSNKTTDSVENLNKYFNYFILLFYYINLKILI